MQFRKDVIQKFIDSLSEEQFALLASVLGDFKNIITEDDQERFVNITQTAYLLSKSRVTIYSLLKKGILTGYRIQGHAGIMLKQTEVLQLIKKINFKYSPVRQ